MRTIMLMCCIAALASCTIANPESGDKIGQIAKVQVEGVICDTTGILVTGKFGGGELKLTVPLALVEQVKHFNETQEFVKITYHTDFIRSACSNDTGNTFLDSVTAHPAGAPEHS
jgi:hypothetical protein